LIMLREAVGKRRVRAGTIASIQAYGSFGANFHSHVHALVTEGVFHPHHESRRVSPGVDAMA
jgi:hypothetical protein